METSNSRTAHLAFQDWRERPQAHIGRQAVDPEWAYFPNFIGNFGKKNVNSRLSIEGRALGFNLAYRGSPMPPRTCTGRAELIRGDAVRRAADQRLHARVTIPFIG